MTAALAAAAIRPRCIAGAALRGRRSSAPARRSRRCSARQPTASSSSAAAPRRTIWPCWEAGRERVLVSAVEHGSVLQAVPEAEHIPVDGDGIVDLDALDRSARRRPASGAGLGHAGQQRDRRHPAGGRNRRDRACAWRAVPLRRGAGRRQDRTSTADAIGADLVTLSAHKLGGPPGVGALVVPARSSWRRCCAAAGRSAAGAPAPKTSPGIAGFAAAAEAAAAEIASYRPGPRPCATHWKRRLSRPCPRRWCSAAAAPRLPNTAAIAMPGIAAETQVIALDLDGVMVSAGAACSSGKVGPSHVLAAMGVVPDLAGSTIRVSLGWRFDRGRCRVISCDAWTALYRRRRGFAGERARHEPDPEPGAAGESANALPIYLDNQATTPARSARARGDAALFHRAIRQSAQRRATSMAISPPRRSSGRAAEVARADRRRSARDRLHLGRHRSEQPRDQGRRTFRPRPSAQGAGPATTS